MRASRMRMVAAVAVVATLALVAACGSDTADDQSQPATDGQAAQLEDGGAGAEGSGATTAVPFTVIDVQELNDRRQATPSLQIVDARTAEEVATGTIPGSINIPHDVIDAGDTEGLALDEPIAVICRSGRRATIAGEALARAGAAEVNVVRPGGVGTWAEAGYPTVVP